MTRLQIGIEQIHFGNNTGKWKIRDSAIQPDGIMVWNEEEGAKNAVMQYGMELFK